MTTRLEPELTLPLASGTATLALVGGKGASLASLAAAGFPVPAGFQITTAAYRRFVAANDLQTQIDGIVGAADATAPDSLERAAAAITELFERGTMPPEMAGAMQEAYAAKGDSPAVAVRSSATAEDLPELSFAGQQETFLDVRGEADLLVAVRRCWASLWSARALGYRARMGVPSDGLAMAVIVQAMVPAEIAGVLFTANPTSGARDEMIVNAARGLGEAIVSGMVTPDHYVADKATLAITNMVPGGREMRPNPNAGARAELAPAPAAAPGKRLLSDAILRDVLQLGIAVERHFDGVPQDIEWAAANGKVWLLQSRPITNLLPAPLTDVRWESPIPDATWVRRQVVEHMPEPLSPLFADLYLEQGLQKSIRVIGEAMGVGELFDRAIDGPFFTTVHGFGYTRGNIRFDFQVAPLMLRAFLTGPLWLFRHGIEHWRDEGLPPYLATIARWQEVDPATASDEELLRGMRELAWADGVYWFATAIAIGTAKVSDSILDSFLRVAMPERGLNSGMFLRGFPSKTLEAEAELDAIARRARAAAELRDFIIATPAERLLADLPDVPGAQRLRDDLGRYFARYGHQIYNLDFVAPTLVDAPLPVLLGLKALVRETRQDGRSRREAVVRERDRLTTETEQSLDPVRRLLFQRIRRWAARFAPYREEALFYVGAAWPALRRFAHELGRRLAEAGSLSAADDVFFLESGEIAHAIAARREGQRRPDLVELAQERRELREARKRLHPPAAVPPTAGLRWGPFDFSERETQRRNLADATTLQGFAVSPGRVTAPASVILSPADFGKMEPGTILVCPTTTPAWTPLFAQAKGLVTDIGGILAHGSIVAREYGIPAVMGTGNATQRIANGQEITIDGTAGTVALDVARTMLPAALEVGA